jgi:putative addiction module component (TIGR02574 family)
LSDAEREELDRRLDDMERNPGTGVPWEQILREMRDRSK